VSRATRSAIALLVGVLAGAVSAERSLVGFAAKGDSIAEPLAGRVGDAARGEAIVRDRRDGNCLACHTVPLDEPFQGEIGPALAGIGARLTPGQIRLRLVDQRLVNPDTLMPPYHSVDALVDVAPEHAGRPALDAQEIEDVVAYLSSLTAP
jgi:sulfur-oxidizing protein SoxX